MSINLNESEYQKVLADIEADLEAVLKSESDALSKADDGSVPPEKSEEAAPEASESAAPEASESPEAAAPEASESAAPVDASPEGAAPEASESPEAPVGAEGGGEEDLESKLMALPEEQLRHLYMAAKQAMFARMSQQGAPGAGDAPPDASAPVAPPAAPPQAPAAAVPPPPEAAMKGEADLSLMKPKAKGEMSSNAANGGPGKSAVLGKSEDAKYVEMEQKLELMAKAVNLVLGQPVRKAITGISHLPKNDGTTQDKSEVTLTKSEITAKLKGLDYAKLTKHDRTAINNYYNKFEVSQIAHLLK